jgi:hypothetical protein
MQWVRFQVLWENIQADGPDTYDWNAYDQTFAQLRESGIKPIGVLNGAPGWARVPGCRSGGCPPADPASFARFAAAAAERYQGQVVAWEVWNEPNLNTAWAPSPDPLAYQRLLAGAYPAIKTADPAATVVSAGLSPAGYEEGVSFDPVSYLDAFYRAGAAGTFDALGWHPYLYPEEMGRFELDSAWSQMADTPVSARSLMVENGDGDKKIWATEFGVSTSPASYTEETQARTLAHAVQLWRTYDFAGPFIVFNYRDKAENPADRQGYYGIVHPDDSPKPAVAELEAAILHDP